MKEPPIRRFASLAGLVVDQDANRCGRATVRIVSGPREYEFRQAIQSQRGVPGDLTVAGPDGHYHFLDLPDGAYVLRGSAPGMKSQDVAVKIERTNEKDSHPKIADPIRLRVKDAENPAKPKPQGRRPQSGP